MPKKKRAFIPKHPPCTFLINYSINDLALTYSTIGSSLNLGTQSEDLVSGTSSTLKEAASFSMCFIAAAAFISPTNVDALPVTSYTLYVPQQM